MSTNTWDESKVRRGQPGNIGQFAEKVQSDTEAAVVVPPDFRSDRARMMDDEIADIETRLGKMKEARRDQHLLDLARFLPAEVTRVVFRADHDEDGNEDSLSFDHADDIEDIDFADLDPAMRDNLYAVAWDCGKPGDFVAGDWMDGEDGYYWVNVDEETALGHAEDFERAIAAEQEANGFASLRVAFGRNAWVERAARCRAHAAGIKNIHLHLPEDKAGVEVVWFEDRDGNLVRPDEANSDHRFIQAQVERLAHATESMKPSGNPDAPLTLEV